MFFNHIITFRKYSTYLNHLINYVNNLNVNHEDFQ